MSYKVEKEWEHLGFKCVVIATDMGYRCGYVAVGPDHPLYGMDYCDEVPERLKVHGGLTFSEGDSKYPIEGENLWWFGFDCAHSGDGKDWNLTCRKVKDFYINNPQSAFILFNEGPVRTLEYCVNECNNLAEQLDKLKKEEKL